MEKVHKDVLRKNRVLLTNDLMVDEKLLSYLVQYGVFTDTMVDFVRVKRICRQNYIRCVLLLPVYPKPAYSSKFVLCSLFMLTYTVVFHLCYPIVPLISSIITVTDHEKFNIQVICPSKNPVHLFAGRADTSWPSSAASNRSSKTGTNSIPFVCRVLTGVGTISHC